MLSARIEKLIEAIPAAQPPPIAPPGPDASGDQGPLPAVERLDEITGIGRSAAQTIIAEVGLNMAQFATAGHLVSWARLSPRTVQSGTKSRSARAGRGSPT